MENLITYSKTSPISDEKFDRLFEILEYSFPPCERGSYALHRSEFTRDEFRCMCYEPEGVPAAFINYYHLRDINALFVEHFASAEELRGKGVGSAVMNSSSEPGVRGSSWKWSRRKTNCPAAAFSFTADLASH